MMHINDGSQGAWDRIILSHLRDVPVICRQSTQSDFTFGFHRHVGVGVVYCTSGRGSYTVGDHTVPFQAGDLLYFDSRAPHRVVMNGLYKRWDVCFWPEALAAADTHGRFRSVLSDFGLAPGCVLSYDVPEADGPRFDRLFRNIRDEVTARRRGFELLLLEYLIELHLLLERLSEEGAMVEPSLRGQPVQDRSMAILSYIEQTLAGPLSVNRIANHFKYSPSQIYRMVRGATGMSPTRYLQERRIARAKSLLEQSDLSVKDIAASVGMADTAYFCTLFRRQTGLTPVEYRARHT